MGSKVRVAAAFVSALMLTTVIGAGVARPTISVAPRPR